MRKRKEKRVVVGACNGNVVRENGFGLYNNLVWL